MARNYNISINEYYHVYNRGVEKRRIFTGYKDYERFQFLLYICNNKKSVEIRNYGGLTSVEKFSLIRKDTLVEIGEYVLMPNHFHVLLREKTEGGISLFMQKLTTAYTMYFNTNYKRSGSLFGGSFKARHADEDQYLKYLYAYINMNPIKLIEPNWREEGIKDKKKAKEFLLTYEYSSYQDFLGLKRPEGRILNLGVFPDYFQEKSSFLKFLNDWIESEDATEV